MTFRTLIRRSLRFHWRSHLGVVLGAAIGSAALIGALVVGDSVKGSLRAQSLERLGKIRFALTGGDRFFTDSLAELLPCDLPDNWRVDENVIAYTIGGASTALVLPGVATAQNGSARANEVLLFGIRQQPDSQRHNHYYEFWSYADWKEQPLLPRGEVLLNEPLARHLNAGVGADVIFRIHKPGAVAGDASIAPRSEQTVTLRLRVTDVVPASRLGNFSLRPTATPPLNAFVNLQELQEAAQLPGRANLIVAGPIVEIHDKDLNWLQTTANDLVAKLGPGRRQSVARFLFASYTSQRSERLATDAIHDLQFDLASCAQLADYEASCNDLPGSQSVELKSRRVFLDAPLINAASLTSSNFQPVLTYLATLLSAGTNATPYSMVTAAGAPWTPAEMKDDEIIVSQWLADDLKVKPGDEIAMSYFLPESGAKLEEATNTFRVHSIVPMEMPWADRTLMPDFPGIEKAESTSDWDAGFPLTYKVRTKDDEYWQQHRGTPKAFITLAAGQKMWGNRFGNLTAIRFPIPTNAIPLTPALSPSEGAGENRSPLVEKPQTAVRAGDLEPSKRAQSLSPLPGGEGQGEGEPNTNSLSTLNPQPSTSNLESSRVTAYKEALEENILANLKPEELGLRFEPVREQALKAAAGSQDFGGLFLGFSFFVIAAALLLMAMLFQFGLEQRAPEIGTLLALGFTPQRVRNLFLREGAMLSLCGGILGAMGGIYFSKAMLHGLNTVWRDAVGAMSLNFHVTGQTLIIGVVASAVVSTLTIWLALRNFVKRPARELLVGDLECGDLSPLLAGDLSPSNAGHAATWVERIVCTIRRAAGRGAARATSRPSGESGVKPPHSKWLAFVALVSAVALVGWAMATGDTSNAGIFFGAGALVLIAGLSFASAWFAKLTDDPLTPSLSPSDGEKVSAGRVRGHVLTLGSLGLRGCMRRRKRSLGTMAMLACGSFLIVSIGVFRLDANRDASQRSSGTGGFALIGETTMPVVQDLNSASGRDFFALNEADLLGVQVVPFRVRQGDEASCLNLNAAQKPRLLGVKPEILEGRFDFAKLIDGEMRQKPWMALKSGEFYPKYGPPLATNEVAAIGDANSIQWAMKKKVGDTIDYVDERGQPFKVRIVGAVANSILQGQLIIDEAEFVKRFPSESGYRMFLIDAPSNAVTQVSATLSRALQDVGLELTPAVTRLNQFNAVQNTYLGTFQVLGGLGLLLGSVGLGIVVLRNVLERRGELALLLAVGFRKRQVERLLLLENGALLLAGLGVGVLAAAVAVLPSVLTPSGQLPYASLGVTLAAVLLNGALWTWVATRLAVRGDLLAALRNE